MTVGEPTLERGCPLAAVRQGTSGGGAAALAGPAAAAGRPAAVPGAVAEPAARPGPAARLGLRPRPAPTAGRCCWPGLAVSGKSTLVHGELLSGAVFHLRQPVRERRAGRVGPGRAAAAARRGPRRARDGACRTAAGRRPGRAAPTGWRPTCSSCWSAAAQPGVTTVRSGRSRHATWWPAPTWPGNCAATGRSRRRWRSAPASAAAIPRSRRSRQSSAARLPCLQVTLGDQSGGAAARAARDAMPQEVAA